MDTWGQLLKSKSSSEHLIFSTGWFTKSTRTIWATKVASTNATTVFADNLVLPYEIEAYCRTENGPKIALKFFWWSLSVSASNIWPRLRIPARQTVKSRASTEGLQDVPTFCGKTSNRVGTIFKVFEQPVHCASSSIDGHNALYLGIVASVTNPLSLNPECAHEKIRRNPQNQSSFDSEFYDNCASSAKPTAVA